MLWYIFAVIPCGDVDVSTKTGIQYISEYGKPDTARAVCGADNGNGFGAHDGLDIFNHRERPFLIFKLTADRRKLPDWASAQSGYNI